MRASPPKKRPARPTRVAILYNVDYLDGSPADPGHSARADVAQVANAVAAALGDGRHDATLVPVDGDLERMRERLDELEPDCAFNLCESLAADARLESAVPIVLEAMAIPYTGSPPAALSAALYKDRVKERLRAAGVPTPEAVVMQRAGDDCALGLPAIVKPVREDGSVGIDAGSVVWDDASLRARVARIRERLGQGVLVERYIDGREINASLVGYPEPRVLPLQEIDFGALPPSMPRIVTYDAKWKPGSIEDLGTRPVLLPALPDADAARVRRVALDAFHAVGLRDYGRIDIRLDAKGTPFVVDVNPNCDLSPDAGLARAAAGVGMAYAELISLLVSWAIDRRAGASVRERA
ncbi:MAG TPA: D-alanine--D-alanine ligase [Polyangiaceae bacterium]|nr:D-alanine--D-alanine ligase [Polyangiaceae bacterium]